MTRRCCLIIGWIGGTLAPRYNATTGEQKYVCVSSDSVHSCAFSRDGKMVVVGCKVTDKRKTRIVS